MKYLKQTLVALIAVLTFTVNAYAALPWGSTGPLQVSGATPTCTYTATALACIENMNANVTSVTLAGMTAGTYYTIVFVQDGTGSRTLTQTPITQATGFPAVPAIPSAANAWTAWQIKATSATAATFVANYDNAPMFDSWNTSGGSTMTSAGTSVASGVTQAQTAQVVPGMTAGDLCICQAQTLPATWQTGIQLACLPNTNSATCEEINPTAGSITPAAITLNIRIFP